MLGKTLAGLFAIGLGVAGCGGNVVFDDPDPTACDPGHGCPMVGCACIDGSVVLDTTCVSGECQPPESTCAERCKDFGGAASAFATEDDQVAIPDCDTFCTRVEINGCKLGCDTLFSKCEAPSSCSPAAAAFWQCATQTAVLSCVDNSVRIEGCDSTTLGVCDAPQAN
ncbi:MAG: hypothetical protein U0271_40705 [Polyangiaceae bacterium]